MATDNQRVVIPTRENTEAERLLQAVLPLHYAGMSVKEAAASAGVPYEAVLDALGQTLTKERAKNIARAQTKLRLEKAAETAELVLSKEPENLEAAKVLAGVAKDTAKFMGVDQGQEKQHAVVELRWVNPQFNKAPMADVVDVAPNPPGGQDGG